LSLVTAELARLVAHSDAGAGGGTWSIGYSARVFLGVLRQCIVTGSSYRELPICYARVDTIAGG